MKQVYSIASVNKAFDILEFLAQQKRTVRLSELSRALGIPKPTMFRYLVTLVQRGYVAKSPTNDEYAFGLKILELSSWALKNVTIRQVAVPFMQDLRDRFQETVNLGLLDGNEVVYVEILESPRLFRMSSHVGGRDHAHTTSMGKSILAFLAEKDVQKIADATGLPRRTQNTICSWPRLRDELEQVRHLGYALDDEENEEGARCIGAPIFDHRGEVIAAMSVSGPAVRLFDQKIEEIGAAISASAWHISQKLGHPEGTAIPMPPSGYR